MTTTINQQIEFLEELRQNFDNNGRETIASKRGPEMVAGLLRDIQENLIAVRLMQHTGSAPQLCDKCSRPLNDKIYAIIDQKCYCDGCLIIEKIV